MDTERNTYRVQETEKDIGKIYIKLDKIHDQNIDLRTQIIKIEGLISNACYKIDKQEEREITCRSDFNKKISNNSQKIYLVEARISENANMINSITEIVSSLKKTNNIVSTTVILAVLGAVVNLVLK